MTSARRLALVYAAILTAVAGLNYVPGLTDDQGRVFGIFALDLFDDALHAASAVWALAAGLTSHRAARVFLILFGAAYLGDGLLGLATGSGFLDFAIFTTGPVELPFGFRVAANLPHLALGSVALAAGLRAGRGA